MLTSCEPKWEGTVRYDVTGTATDVDIEYGDDNEGTDPKVQNVALPWSSGDISANAEDQSSFEAGIIVKNNTANNDTVNISIYIENSLVVQKSGSGPYFEVLASYLVENDYH